MSKVTKPAASSVPVITVDGPSGSGKGTISRLLSEATGFALLDSGALYRLTALACSKAGVEASNEASVAGVAQQLDVKFTVVANAVEVQLAGEVVTQAIRKEAIGMLASKVAAYPSVRAALLTRQRDFLQAPGLVADGRDMGTVVFPHAPVKVFLTASPEERAKRRVLQLQALGTKAIDEAKILADIKARDERDTNRSAAPLLPAEDALQLDSTQMSIEEVYTTIMKEVDRRQLRAAQASGLQTNRQGESE